MNEQPTVYTAIQNIQGELARIGISKDRKNQQQGYQFRGIDDVYAALAPLLAKHRLCILPRCLSREVTKEVNSKGTTLFYVVVMVEFDFVSFDGSKHTVCMAGEAMDSGDKATNKAMSAAYKYACFQAFCIPTEGDNDADAYTHEIAPEPQKPKPEASWKMRVWVTLKSVFTDLTGETCRAKLIEFGLISDDCDIKKLTEPEWETIHKELVRNPVFAK